MAAPTNATEKTCWVSIMYRSGLHVAQFRAGILEPSISFFPDILEPSRETGMGRGRGRGAMQYREDGEGGGGVAGDALAGVGEEQRDVLALAAAAGLPAEHVGALHPLARDLPPQQHAERHRRRRRLRRHRHGTTAPIASPNPPRKSAQFNGSPPARR